MADRTPPPWRSKVSSGPPRSPKPTIPSKRRADAEEEAWIAEEDNFVLRQAKKKARLRVKGARAKPIDWLAVTLTAIDTTPTDSLDNDDEEADLEIPDPEGVFENLEEEELVELEKDIESYLALEKSRSNKDFWEVCPPSHHLPNRILMFTDYESHL